jgi:hypothetical protein
VKIYKNKAERNIEYAQRWLNRAIKDFNLFKKLVPFDKRTNKPVRCSDPALAVYLLQQSIEKAVKAAAIASGRYKTRDFIRYFRHNSLALVIDLNTKIVSQIQFIGLGPIATMMGIDLADGSSKLAALKNQIMGTAPLLDKQGRKVDFKTESRKIPPEIIDQLLDMVMKHRTLLLDVIRTTLRNLPREIRKEYGEIDDPLQFLKQLSESIAVSLKIQTPSEEQMKVPLEFAKIMANLGFSPVDGLNRWQMTENYLGAWAFSHALLWLSYLTFGHEESARYPLRQKGDIQAGKTGCDDYDDSLGIVNRIGRIGYVTSLTLNDMKTEIHSLASFFAVDLKVRQ